MSAAKIIDGKARALALREQIADLVSAFVSACGRAPGLAVVLVGQDPASQIYVRSKKRATLEAGMVSIEHCVDAAISEAELLTLIQTLNHDQQVDGILVQLPLPQHINEQTVIGAISPAKDVDGFNVVNAGRLMTGLPAMVPCTPLGCLLLLKEEIGDLSGLDAVVIGRSNIVGKPMAQLLLAENCTVTIAHSRTRDLCEVVQRADIVVAAVGRAEMVKRDWIKRGAVVIDVGINRVQNPSTGGEKIVGDVEAAVAEVASVLTPVPGGVGPMTIAILLRNTLVAASNRAGYALDKAALTLTGN